MCENFQVQKIHKRKYIRNLPTCVAVGNNQENHFTTVNFDTLPRAENLLFTTKLLAEDHLYFNNMCAKFQGQNIYPKKHIKNLPTSVTMRNNFKVANFNNPP